MTAPNSPSPAGKAQPPARPSPGPGDSLGAVVDQDALADGEGAVVPHQEEVKDGVRHPGSHRAGCKGTCWGHGHCDSPWDTHPQDRDLLLTTHCGHKGHPTSRAVCQVLYQDLLFSSGHSRMGEKDKGGLGGDLCPAPSQTHLELRRNRQEKETMSRMMVR